MDPNLSNMVIYMYRLVMGVCVLLGPAMQGMSMYQGDPSAGADDLPTSPGTPHCKLVWAMEGLQADCRALGLTSVPTDLPSATENLDLSSNRITFLHNDSFVGLPNLKILDISNNNMADIDEGAFRTLSNLEKITLEHNHLESIKDGVFKWNSKLSVLDFSYNRLARVPMNALHLLQYISVLDLAGNNIQLIDFTGFRSKNLSSLTLSHNDISIIQASDFDPLQNASIDYFSFVGNKISILPDGVFSALKHVQYLRFNRNLIEVFSIKPFLGMTSLKYLDLSYNNISIILPIDHRTTQNDTENLPPLIKIYLQENIIQSIPSGAFQGLDKLQELNIDQCHLRNLHNQSFTGLPALQTLNLMNNKLAVISSDPFLTLPQLKTLKLSLNKFKYFSPSYVKSDKLEALELSRCQIQAMSGEEWSLPALETLDLTQNSLEKLDTDIFKGLNNLKILKLSRNRITTMKNYAFRGLDHLQELDLSSMGHLGSFYSPFGTLGQLTVLDLSGTTFKPSSRTFAGLRSLLKLTLRSASITGQDLWESETNSPCLSNMPLLENLYLSHNSLDDMHPGTFGQLTKVRNLKVDNCAITALHPDVFLNMTSLLYLYIDHNNIKDLSPQHMEKLESLVGVTVHHNDIKLIDKNLFAKNPHLSFLYISNNAITWIAEGTILPKHYLDISNNPITCLCDLKWFRTWIDKSNITLGDASQTLCSQSSLASLIGKPLLSFQPAYVCGPNTALLVSTSLIIVAFIFGIVIAYQNRWWLSYKCFHLKLLVIGYDEMEDGREREDYEHDLTLIYDDHDEEWVKGTFKPGLQENLPHFDRIICGDDNLPLGMYYMDAIIYVIENSFKTVLVVSHHAVNNHNFINKLRQTFEQMNEEEVEKALLVFVDDIPDRQLPYLVRLFLSQNKPYLLWNEDKYGQRLFWDKFVKNMVVNKKMNDLLPI